MSQKMSNKGEEDGKNIALNRWSMPACCF